MIRAVDRMFMKLDESEGKAAQMKILALNGSIRKFGEY